jgi:hypothetical protein
MELKINRYSLQIIPEDEVDEAYIEEVLGMKKAGDYVILKRVNSVGLSCIAYLNTELPPPEPAPVNEFKFISPEEQTRGIQEDEDLWEL